MTSEQKKELIKLVKEKGNKVIRAIRSLIFEELAYENIKSRFSAKTGAEERIKTFIDNEPKGLYLSIGLLTEDGVYFWRENELEDIVDSNYYTISTEPFEGKTVPLSQLNGSEKVLNLRDIIYINDYLDQDTSKGKDAIEYKKGQMDEALVVALKAKHQKVLASNSDCEDKLKSGFSVDKDFVLAMALGLSTMKGGSMIGAAGITKASRAKVNRVYGSIDDYVKKIEGPKFKAWHAAGGAAVAAAITGYNLYNSESDDGGIVTVAGGAAVGAFAPIAIGMTAFLYKKSVGKMMQGKLRGENASNWLMGSGLSIVGATALLNEDNSCWSHALAFGLVLGGLYGSFKKGLGLNFWREANSAISKYTNQKQLQKGIEDAFLDKVYRIRDLQLVDAIDNPPAGMEFGWFTGGMDEVGRDLFADAFRPPTKLLGTSDAINSHIFFDKDHILKHPASARYEEGIMEKGIDAWELAMKQQYKEVSESVIMDVTNLFGKIGREEKDFVNKMINRSELVTKLSKGMDNPGNPAGAQKAAVTEFLQKEYKNTLGQELPGGKSTSFGWLFDESLLGKMHFTSGGKSKIFKGESPGQVASQEQVITFKAISDDYFNSIMTGAKKSDDEIKALGEKFKKDLTERVFDLAGNPIKENIKKTFGSKKNFFKEYEKVIKGAHTLKDILIDIETAKRTVKNITNVENSRVTFNDIEKVSKVAVERVFSAQPKLIKIINGNSSALINALKNSTDLGWMTFATIIYGISVGSVASLFTSDAADEIKTKIDTLNSTYNEFEENEKTEFIDYINKTAVGSIRKLQVENNVKRTDQVLSVIDKISKISGKLKDLYETAVKLTLQHNLELKDEDLKKNVVEVFGLSNNSLAVYSKLLGALDETKIREALDEKFNNIKESNVYSLDNIRSLVSEVIREQQENELPSLQDTDAAYLEPQIATADPGMGEYYSKVLKYAQTKLPFGDNVYRVQYGAIQNTTENAPALLDEETADSFYNLLLDWINTGLEPLKLHGKTPSYDSVLDASDRKETSQHKHGMAIDINIPYGSEDPMHLKYKQKLLELSLKNGFRGFGFGPTVMHLDTRQEYGWWIYGGEKWDFAGTIGSVVPIRSSAFRDLGLAAGGWPSSEAKQTFLAMTDIKNKKGVREVKKQDLNKLMVEFLNENSGQGYSKYPYSSSVTDEEEPKEDYIEEWKALSIEVIRDESRNTAIQIAKILVKDLELFEDVLDLAGHEATSETYTLDIA